MLKRVQKFELWINVSELADERPAREFWLLHWRHQSMSSSRVCSEFGCTRAATHGAHVVRRGGGNEEYVVPVCRLHYRRTGAVLLLRKTVAVLARKADPGT